MIDRKLLLADLQKQVTSLEKNLREQTESVEEVHGRLRGEYDRAFKIGRTAAIWASPADIYVGFLAGTTNRLRLTDEALTSWRPPKTTRGRKAKV